MAASSARARSAPRAQRRRRGTPFARYWAGARAWASRVVPRRSCRGRAFPPRSGPGPSGRCLFLLTATWLGRRATARCGAGPLGTCEADAVRDHAPSAARAQTSPRAARLRAAGRSRRLGGRAEASLSLARRQRPKDGWCFAQLSEMRRRAERARAAQRDSARALSLDRSEGDPVYGSAWSRVGGPERSEMLSGC